MRNVLAIVAVGLGIVGSAAVLGCGGDEGLPDEAVAKVGDALITKSDFDEAFRFATGRDDDPRDHAACVAAKQRQLTSEPGAAQRAETQLEAQCKHEYEETKRNVMDSLIKAEWTRQAAEAQGVAVTDAEVRKALDEARAAGVLDREALTGAGVSQRRIEVGVRQNLLHTRLTEQMTEKSKTIPSEEVAEYYRRNLADLTLPDRREVRIVMTRSRARAEAARAGLEAGRGWPAVANEYSIHFSRTQGGRITAEWKGGDPDGLGAAIFRAKRGELVGPVKDDDIWGVFVVDQVKPAFRPTLEQARQDITERLQAVRREQALKTFARESRAKTICAEGFVVSACGNGPQPAEGQPSA